MSYAIVPGSCPGGPAAGVAFPPYAVTRHKDVQHAGDPIDTVTFVDGLERVIQTKKDPDRDQNGSGTVVTGMSVSGQVLFDGRGRVKSQAQPGFSTPVTTTFVTPATPRTRRRLPMTRSTGRRRSTCPMERRRASRPPRCIRS